MGLIHGTGLIRQDPARAIKRLGASQHEKIAAALKSLRGSADLTQFAPRVLDQGQRSMCWAFSAATLKFVVDSQKSEAPAVLQSPLFYGQIVYGTYRSNATKPGDTLPPLSDQGAQLDDGVAAFSKWGSVPFQGEATDLSDVPDTTDGSGNEGPLPETTVSMVQLAAGYLFGGPYDITPGDSAGDLVAASLEAGIPVWLGGLVGSGLQNYVAGQIEQPCDPNEPGAGGHARAILGYKTVNGSRIFDIRNSWGPGFGNAGDSDASEGVITSGWSLLPFAEAA